jgi:hypothetical protein
MIYNLIVNVPQLACAAQLVSGYSVKFQRYFLTLATWLLPKSSSSILSANFCSELASPAISYKQTLQAGFDYLWG